MVIINLIIFLIVIIILFFYFLINIIFQCYVDFLLSYFLEPFSIQLAFYLLLLLLLLFIYNFPFIFLIAIILLYLSYSLNLLTVLLHFLNFHSMIFPIFLKIYFQSIHHFLMIDFLIFIIINHYQNHLSFLIKNFYILFHLLLFKNYWKLLYLKG